jgi:hypothetical protein
VRRNASDPPTFVIHADRLTIVTLASILHFDRRNITHFSQA